MESRVGFNRILHGGVTGNSFFWKHLEYVNPHYCNKKNAYYTPSKKNLDIQYAKRPHCIGNSIMKPLYLIEVVSYGNETRKNDYTYILSEVEKAIACGTYAVAIK